MQIKTNATLNWSKWSIRCRILWRHHALTDRKTWSSDKLISVVWSTLPGHHVDTLYRRRAIPRPTRVRSWLTNAVIRWTTRSACWPAIRLTHWTNSKLLSSDAKSTLQYQCTHVHKPIGLLRDNTVNINQLDPSTFNKMPQYKQQRLSIYDVLESITNGRR